MGLFTKKNIKEHGKTELQTRKDKCIKEIEGITTKYNIILTAQPFFSNGLTLAKPILVGVEEVEEAKAKADAKAKSEKVEENKTDDIVKE